MSVCKSCGEKVNYYLSKGYCHKCYAYFISNGYDTWYPSEYGSLSFVQKENSEQYGMPICHICGKAYTKLQQHIFYAHNMTKAEYCKQFGLDRKIQMTAQPYHEKMRHYAYKYDMDLQVLEAGKNTRFTKDTVPKYERSYQTKQRLAVRGKEIAVKYGKFSKKEVE